jgi:hypothetical protein
MSFESAAANGSAGVFVFVPNLTFFELLFDYLVRSCKKRW